MVLRMESLSFLNECFASFKPHRRPQDDFRFGFSQCRQHATLPGFFLMGYGARPTGCRYEYQFADENPPKWTSSFCTDEKTATNIFIIALPTTLRFLMMRHRASLNIPPWSSPLPVAAWGFERSLTKVDAFGSKSFGERSTVMESAVSSCHLGSIRQICPPVHEPRHTFCGLRSHLSFGNVEDEVEHRAIVDHG